MNTAHLSWDEVRPALLDRRVDAVVTRLPLQTAKLHVTVLYDEPRVLVVPSTTAWQAENPSLSPISPTSP